MNFTNILNREKKSTLSRLGLNISTLCNPKDKNKIHVNRVVYTIALTIELIKGNEFDVYYDICETTFYKKETLLKNIWSCKNNVYPSRLITIMKDDNKRMALIERLELMLNTINNNA